MSENTADNAPAPAAEPLSEAMNLAEAQAAILKTLEADEAQPEVTEEAETESQPVSEDEEVTAEYEAESEEESEEEEEYEPEDNREEEGADVDGLFLGLASFVCNRGLRVDANLPFPAVLVHRPHFQRRLPVQVESPLQRVAGLSVRAVSPRK